MKFFIDALHADQISETTLGQMIALYTRLETNPRYLDAQATGGHYGFRHANNIARESRILLDILSDRRTLLNRPVRLINRRTVKDIGVIITDNFGRTVKSRQLYKCLKVMFTQAADDGLIPQSPAMNLPDIHTMPTRVKFALPASDIRRVIRSHVFPSQVARDAFVILATTGLRK